MWRILVSMALAFERCRLVFSLLLTVGVHFFFCDIDINIIHLKEICQKLLCPYSQTSEGVLHAQPERCFQVGCLGKGCILGKEDLPLPSGQAQEAFFFHQISSLGCYAVRQGEKLCHADCGQGLSLFALSLTQFFAELWFPMPQGSVETKCLVTLQKKPHLFLG